MSIDKNLYAGINATYIRSLLLSAGFSNTDLSPKPLVLVQKLEDYLQSYDWTVDWYDSIDPTKLNDKLLSLYDELSDVRDMKLDELNTVDVDSVAITDAIEPVRDDVKLLPSVIEPLPVEVEPEPVEVIVPQEVVSEPQEDCLSTTTLNEDKTMSIILPDFSTNGNTFQLVPVEFTSIWYEVPTVEPTVELNGKASELTCDVLSGQFTELAYPLMSPLTCDVLNGQSSDVLEGWTGQCSELTCHISDGWFGQCCLLTERPLSTEEREAVEHKVEQFANGVKAHVKSYKRELRPTQEIETLARIKELVEQSQVPTITTKSGKVVPVSPHCITPHGNAPIANCITSPKVTSAIGEAFAVDPVTEFKSTLFNLDNFDVVKQAAQALLDMFSPDEYNTLRDKYGVDVMKKAFNTLQGDVRTRIRSMINKANTIRNGIELTVVATQAPKATVAPKVSTATFAPNFNSLVIAKYRELNNGIIKDSLVLNKLTSALRANNVEAYANLVTTFGNPTAVALHRQAYDAVVSAS